MLIVAAIRKDEWGAAFIHLQKFHFKLFYFKYLFLMYLCSFKA